MTERQSSGLVKKGKFVRALMDLMNDGVVRSISAIMSDGKGEIGPTQDYVQTNLDKLVASGEMMLEDGNYFLENPVATVQERDGPNTGFVPVQGQGNAPKPVARPIPVIMSGAKLPRNSDFETFLCCAFVNETPRWEEANDYYCATHDASWSIVKFDGRIGGERVKFS